MQGKFGKGILIVLFANIINLIVGVLSSLIIPKYLSIETYAAIKEYQLYFSYIGILHLGYNDAMYLRYGGKTLEQLDKNEAIQSISIIRLYSFVISLLGVIVFTLLKLPIMVCIFAVTTPTILLSYYQFVYQACGEFNKYGKILNIISIGTFLINMSLIFVFKTDNYMPYLIGYVILSAITSMIVEIIFSKTIHSRLSFTFFSFEKLFNGMKNGILLTLGNFSSILMTSMDRWFVRILMDTVMFAQYSFAVSLESFLSVLISPITVTLYNYFCTHKEKKDIDAIRRVVVLFGSLLITVAFPAKFVLEIYLTKYIEASSVIVLLFASQFFYVIVKGIYINLYKAKGEIRKYFRGLVVVIIFGFIANWLLYLVLHTKESFAVATLISSIVWLSICITEFKDISVKEIVYIIICLTGFIVCGYCFNAITGLAIYLALIIVLSMILMRASVAFVLNYLRCFLKRQ